MLKQNQKAAKRFSTTPKINIHQQPTRLSQVDDTEITAQTVHGEKRCSPMSKELKAFDAGDNADSVSETYEYSSPSRSTLTTPDIDADVTRFKTPERMSISHLIGNVPRTKSIEKSPFGINPRAALSPKSSQVVDVKSALTEKPLVINSPRKVINEKPPPTPNKHLKTLERLSAPEMTDASTLLTSSNEYANRGQRPNSCGKNVTFDPHHEVISPSLSKCSSSSNLSLPKLQGHTFRECPDRRTPRTYGADSDTNRTIENKPKGCNSSVNPEIDSNEKLGSKRVSLGREDRNRTSSEHEISQNFDQNLNKQRNDSFPKAKLLEDLNEEQRFRTSMFNNHDNKEELFARDIEHTLDNDVSNKRSSKEEIKNMTRHHLENAQIKQEQSKPMDERLTNESMQHSLQWQASHRTRPEPSKEIPQQHDQLPFHAVYENNSPYALNSNLANPPGFLELQDFTRYSRHPVHLPGSFYDCYYEDEMSFSPCQEQRQYWGRVGRGNWKGRRPLRKVRQPRLILQPHRSVIVFNPPEQTNMSTATFGAFQASPPLKRRSGINQPDMKLDERYFPCQHRLGSSSDLNREMKRVMRFHNCRNMPSLGPETSEEQFRPPPHFFFNNHGWFPRSTTGMMKAKYRDTLANVQRQWYDHWREEVTFRNVVKEPKKPRRHEQGARPRPPSIPQPPQKTHHTPETTEAAEREEELSVLSSILAYDNQTFLHSMTEGQCTSPEGPMCSPRPPSAARLRADMLSRSSDVAKAASDNLQPFSGDGIHQQYKTSYRGAQWIGTEGNPCHYDRADAAELRRTSSTGDTDTLAQRRQQQLRHQRGFQEYGMMKDSPRQAGDTIDQEALQEAAFNHPLSTEPRHETSSGANSKDVTHPFHRGSTGSNAPYERVLSSSTRPNVQSGGDVLETFDSKEDENGVSEITKNHGRHRGTKPSSSKERGPTVSWEIKHLDYMLLKTKEESERTSI